MKSKDIFLIIFIIAAAAFSFYRRYSKNNQPGNKTKDRPSGQSFTGSSGDDDYEPYSGK